MIPIAQSNPITDLFRVYGYHLSSECCFLSFGRFKELQTGVMEIKRKEPKLQRILNKMLEETNKCTAEMAVVKKSVQDVRKLAAIDRKLVSKFKVNAHPLL